MPGTIPAPIVPTQPQAGGSFWAGGSSSGMDETSGISCDFSGPHAITTQTLGAQYFRNPNYHMSAVSLGLSAALINPVYKVLGTGLLVRIVAGVTVTKSYDCYATSAWTQNQTFTINAVSADTYGNAYGTAAEFSSAYILGTGGSIETLQPYYHRRPWDDASDVESTSAIIAFNYQMAVRSMSYSEPYIVTSGAIDALTEWGEMENGCYGWTAWGKSKWEGNDFLSDPHIGASFPLYYLQNGYTYSQESLGQLKSMVDYYIGDKIANGTPWGAGMWFHRDGSFSTGLPAYDWKRHDWSTIT